MHDDEGESHNTHPSPSRDRESGRERETERRPASKIVGSNWGLSIAVVIVMIGAAVANTTMLGKADSRTATLETKLDATAVTLLEIKGQISEITRTTQSELLAMQRDNGDLRTQLAREVGDLRVQIAEIRAAVIARDK